MVITLIATKLTKLLVSWKMTTNVPQIADGGDLKTQMFGLTTNFHKMQEATINNEPPAIGNVLLAEVFFVKLNKNQNGTNICICLC